MELRNPFLVKSSDVVPEDESFFCLPVIFSFGEKLT